MAGTPHTETAIGTGQVFIGFEIGPDGTVVRWTQGAQAGLGWTADEVLGSPPPVELPGAIAAAVGQIVDDEVISANASWVRADGTPIEVAISATQLIGADGAALAVVARDISAHDMMQQQLEAYARDVRESYGRELLRHDELERTYRATVEALAIAVEAKDDTTGGHIRRVLALGLLLAREHLGPAADEDAQLEYGFLLHDVGKLAVPDAVLNKPGALDAAEWSLMKRHPAEGARILAGIPFLGDAIGIVASHHERWDGGGYPQGLSGESIPIGARIFAIVDTVDAMTSDRPYRAGLPLETALEELTRQAGRQFDPACVASFLRLDCDEIRGLLEPTMER